MLMVKYNSIQKKRIICVACVVVSHRGFNLHLHDYRGSQRLLSMLLALWISYCLQGHVKIFYHLSTKRLSFS